MRIVIDMQGAQAESRTRGVGRYSHDFALAVAKLNGTAEVHVLLSLAFPESARELRREFDQYLPAGNIHVWQPPQDIRGLDPARITLRHAAELILESVLASLDPDIVHVTSPFEGYADDAVFGLHTREKRYAVTATLHDLIPLENAHEYLDSDPRYADFYFRQLASLSKVDGLLTNSDSSTEEARRHLPTPMNRIVNVSAGVSQEFRALAQSAGSRASVLSELAIETPFILYVGGFEERKNVSRLITAFGQLSFEARAHRKLVLAGWVQPDRGAHVREAMRQNSLTDGDVIITGKVSDVQLTALMSACDLFVFPSLQEGFGLPVLEAMTCGAPVIASNATSVPEIVGMPEALFDPRNVDDIRVTMEKALVDKKFRAALIKNSPRRAAHFSWDESARKALDFWQTLSRDEQSRRQKTEVKGQSDAPKARLLIVGPLPPAASGIADYISELAPVMASHYEVVVIVDKPHAVTSAMSNVKVRDVKWFVREARAVDRVMYHMGNSPLHAHIPDLMKVIPGTLVLHDFYLGNMYEWLQVSGIQPDVWSREIYHSHGYEALSLSRTNAAETKLKYPASLGVLQRATGVVTHSHHSQELGRKWFSQVAQKNWDVVPLLRMPAHGMNREEARRELGIARNAFVVCAFGFMDATKLNDLLIGAWLTSRASDDEANLLILVGGGGGSYLEKLRGLASDGDREHQVITTGFVSQENYRRYLAAADIAVQLRADSRGTTSAAVLDCLNYGVPTIVNTHGSLEEIDFSTVIALRDHFEATELTGAIESLFDDERRRQVLSTSGNAFVAERHGPAAVIEKYSQALERHHHQKVQGVAGLVDEITKVNRQKYSSIDLNNLAEAVSSSVPLENPSRTVFLDVTSIRELDVRTGVQRVAKAILQEMLIAPPLGLRVEPVFLNRSGNRWDYFYARQYADDLKGYPNSPLEDSRAKITAEDAVVCLDLSGPTLIEAAQSGLFQDLQAAGATVHCIAFDLLPVSVPEVFPHGAFEAHTEWLEVISEFNSVAAISQTVANELTRWLDDNGKDPAIRARVAWFPLGADFDEPVFASELTPQEHDLLASLEDAPTFLMVGTIEPRKGYDQALEAFTQMWDKGVCAHLVIVGKPGWSTLADHDRKNIPEIERILREHPEAGTYLHWVGQASEALLEELYRTSQCLLAASYDEGFGLPLIEAAHHGLPILARDIPVFREVAGNHATYFANGSARDLAEGITQWLAALSTGKPMPSTDMPYFSWAESAKKLSAAVLSQN